MNILLSLISLVVSVAFAILCLFINAEILGAILLGKTSMWATLLVIPILIMMICAVDRAFDFGYEVIKRFRR